MPSSAPEVTTNVDVGERLRVIRSMRRRTLRDVAERAGLSESFLSQVERGRSSASIASLRRIAEALGISIADLFQPGGLTEPRVLRREDRPTVAFGVVGRKMLLTPRPSISSRSSSASSIRWLHRGWSSTRTTRRELFVVLRGTKSGWSSATACTCSSPVTASTTAARFRTASRTPATKPAEVMWIIRPPSY